MIRQAQEVSYLWPMSGVFSSAVLMAAIEPEKYTVYVDSMVMAMERYYDTTRVPFGYQAYPVQFGKVDRYYDDKRYLQQQVTTTLAVMTSIKRLWTIS